MEHKATSKEILIAVVTCAFIGLIMYNVNELVGVFTIPVTPSSSTQTEKSAPELTALQTLSYPKGYSKELLFDMGPLLASSQLSEGTKSTMSITFRSFNSYNTDIQIYKMMLEQNKWTVSSMETSPVSTEIVAKKGIESATITLKPMTDYQNMTLVTVNYQK